MTDRYKLEGHVAVPCEDISEWGKTMSGPRHVGDTRVGPLRVSTVFLGFDHAFGEGPPLLFETMIFSDDAPRYDKAEDYQERYSTWEQAEAGHEVAIAWAKAHLAS